MTDPIADLLTRIRNAGARRLREVVVPYSKIKEQIVMILKNEKYIENYSIETDAKGFKTIVMTLRYEGKQFAIQSLKRVSKPGIRRYVGYNEVPRVLGGIGICIISTSQGLMTGDDAKKKKVGGELLLTIY